MVEKAFISRRNNKQSCSTPAGWDVTYYYDAYTAGIFSGYTGATTNALGQRTGMLDSTGHTIWSFDQRGNLIEEEKTVGTESFSTEWEYTIAGLLESMAYPLVNSTGETIYTTYTPQGSVASVGSLYNTYITLSYDEANRAVNRTYFTSGDGLQTNFDYYDWNEQVSNVPQGGLLESSQTGTLADADSLVSLAYVYDAVGNVASITDLVQSPAQAQNFTYDSLYRLTGATGSAGFGGAYSETYTYDTVGRMATKDGATLSYTATRTGTCQANSLTPAASSTITHAVSSKSGGNTYTYDCNGNAITRGDQTLIYDEENRLVEVQENSVTVAEYVYDGDGNQVKAIVTSGDLTIDTIFIGTYYQQTTTLDKSVSPAVESTEWEKYYYAGKVRLAMRKDSDDPLYLIGDHLGSTTLVLDTAGLEVAKQSYLPFGEDWGVSVTDLPTDFTYTGQREAAEIGFLYYVARWYDSEIGHFLQGDTIIPEADNPMAWNKFSYVYYSPINNVDPSGHMVDDEGSYNPWQKTVKTDEGVFVLPLISVRNQSLIEPIVTTIPVDQSLYPGSWPIPNNDKPPLELSIYSSIESGPLMVSIFLETGYGYGPHGYTVGIGLVSNFEHDYLYWWTGRTTGFDIGSSWSIGVEMINEDNIDNFLGPDVGNYFGGSLNDVGLTAGTSPSLDSFSIAYSPGLRIGYGYEEIVKQLLWQID